MSVTASKVANGQIHLVISGLDAMAGGGAGTGVDAGVTHPAAVRLDPRLGPRAPPIIDAPRDVWASLPLPSGGGGVPKDKTNQILLGVGAVTGLVALAVGTALYLQHRRAKQRDAALQQQQTQQQQVQQQQMATLIAQGAATQSDAANARNSTGYVGAVLRPTTSITTTATATPVVAPSSSSSCTTTTSTTCPASTSNTTSTGQEMATVYHPVVVAPQGTQCIDPAITSALAQFHTQQQQLVHSAFAASAGIVVNPSNNISQPCSTNASSSVYYQTTPQTVSYVSAPQQYSTVAMVSAPAPAPWAPATCTSGPCLSMPTLTGGSMAFPYSGARFCD
jgi:hypothetical protein